VCSYYLMTQQIIANKYQVGTQLGSGSFGSVFRGLNIRTGEEVAIKMEPKTTGLLANEARIYRYLSSMQKIPKMRWFGTTGSISFLVLDLLGDESLTSVQLSFEDAILCGIQMINIIEDLHFRKLLHRDIKPANFVFGRETDDIYLVDFGFCRSYEDINGTHIEKRSGKSIMGTPMFASDNVRKGIEPSRRDDLWSIAKTVEFICDKIELSQMRTICDLMDFEETPDYNRFRNIMKRQN
jgi:casein kinase 1